MKNFEPSLYISIGANHNYFTLRETYQHFGRGEVCNGVFTGTVEVRSFHHFNLSQNADEALEKARQAANDMGLPLTTQESASTLQSKMVEIQRMSAEQLEIRANRLKWEAEQRQLERENEFQTMLNNGRFPFGKYRGSEFFLAPCDYLQWLINAEFEPETSYFKLAEVLKRNPAFADLVLPKADKTATVGTIGKRQQFSATVTRKSYYDGFYGRTYIVTMVTDDGVCLVSKSASFCPKMGEKLNFAATVKEFSEYRGQAQTVIQRISVK